MLRRTCTPSKERFSFHECLQTQPRNNGSWPVVTGIVRVRWAILPWTEQRSSSDALIFQAEPSAYFLGTLEKSSPMLKVDVGTNRRKRSLRQGSQVAKPAKKSGGGAAGGRLVCKTSKLADPILNRVWRPSFEHAFKF